ncbi:MAG: phage portal protein [Ramlibacter sp.]
MGALARMIVGERKDAYGDGYGVFAELLQRSLTSKSGVAVTRDKALRVACLFACCRVLADGVAQVPFKVMLKSASPVSRHPQREDADQHPLYDLLYRQPNDWQTSFEFREQMMFHALLARRGAFAFKNVIRVRGVDQIGELILLNPDLIEPVQNRDWTITYIVRGRDGDIQRLPQSAIWHLRGPSWDGFQGMDILNIAREAIGLAIATEQTHAKFHANGIRPSGVYSIDATLNKPQQEDLVKWLKSQAADENAGGAMVIDRGAKWYPQQVTSGVDAQHLETRRNQLEEICRFLRVLPIMVGHSDKTATFASAEAMFLAHMVHTLMPWYERIQQSADVNLLSRDDRRAGYYTKLVEGGLMRGDMKATAEYLARLTLAGILERNEARALLDRNPLAGLDEPLTPTNMTNDPSGAPAGNPTGTQS